MRWGIFWTATGTETSAALVSEQPHLVERRAQSATVVGSAPAATVRA